MTTKTSFELRGRNPDVLTCIANLSNDEVFTPPGLANQMLDSLADAWASANNGANIWADKNVKFLDPFTKSGVFLREITSRLTNGLKKEIPDLEERVNHILTKQVFGIAITNLTSLLARRSVYCSKHAKGNHSIAKGFKTDAGNIWFERTEHTWNETKCVFCGAPKAILDRGEELENYAYAFIHTDNIRNRLKEIFGGSMQFDVIIGNPPYQMKGGAGGSSDSSIYQLFVEQAKNLQPKFLSMVVPSRWLAGGRGLDKFREEMLTSGKLKELVDFPAVKDVFPGLSFEGGVCYFLWAQSYVGLTNVTTVRGKNIIGPVARRLDEFDVFVRDLTAIEILHKVQTKKEQSITDILTSDTPFGIATNFDGFHEKTKSGDISLYYVRSGTRGVGFLKRKEICKNTHLIDMWKVLTPEARGGNSIPSLVLGKPQIVEPGSVCTQSFLAFWVSNEIEAKSLHSYLCTKFFRFLVSLRKITQHALRSTYAWVPMQSLNQHWTDKELYKKYGLTKEEIEYIESVIKPMNLEETEDE